MKNKDPRFGSAPIDELEALGKMIFMSPEKEREWNRLPESEKDFVRKNLVECSKKMETKICLQTLAHVINELGQRISKLEDKESLVSEFGCTSQFNVHPASNSVLRDQEGNAIACKCGHPATQAIMGKQSYLATCPFCWSDYERK